MPDDDASVSVFGVKLDHLPRWVVVSAALGLCASAVALAWWMAVRQPDLITVKQANEQLQASVDEYGRHIAEAPEATATLLDDARGKLVVQRYADGCVVLARAYGGRTRSKLLLDLTLDPDSHAPHHVNLLSVVVEARGQCLNPHPGQFRTWYGRRQECWIEVWRQWPDSCTHRQWFDTCHNTWDTNPDGTPKVEWTACAH